MYCLFGLSLGSVLCKNKKCIARRVKYKFEISNANVLGKSISVGCYFVFIWFDPSIFYWDWIVWDCFGLLELQSRVS